MAIPTWPTAGGFPQSVQKGYTENHGANILRSPMDSGPAKQRWRGNRPSTLSVSFILNTSQVTTLENFITNDLRGTRRFLFPHPRTTQQVEVRIVPQGSGDLYQLQYLAPGYWQAQLNLEVLP